MLDGHDIYMPDNEPFIYDRIMCSYAYVINLDDNVLEVYTSEPCIPCSRNRFWRNDFERSRPCDLIVTFPLGSPIDQKDFERQIFRRLKGRR